MDAQKISPLKPICVYTDMVADMFHYGHMSFLKKVRQHFGNQPIRLVVGLNSDSFVTSYKRHPIQTLEERMATVHISGLADEVVVAPNQMTLELAPDCGYRLVEQNGGDQGMWYDKSLVHSNKFILIPRTLEFGISTTDLINRILQQS